MDDPLGQETFKKQYFDNTAYSTFIFYFLLVNFEEI